MKICVSTVVTKDFLPGGLVLFQSLLDANPWFEGDLVIIHDGLLHSDLAKFRIFEKTDQSVRVQFLEVSDKTKIKLKNLVNAIPSLANRVPRFYSLEVFLLSGYDKILFLDCDMLVRGDLESVFCRNDALVACPDGPHLRGNFRDRDTFEEVPPSHSSVLKNTFNAGFMVIDKALVSSNAHRSLLSYINTEFWAGIRTAHTDQVLYNVNFDGQVSYIDKRYNYLMLHINNQGPKTSSEFEEAKVLHFNGPLKPWMPDRAVRGGQLDYETQKALSLWNKSYLDYLEAKNKQTQSDG